MSAPAPSSTSRLRHARTVVTASALAAGSFALAVACGSSAPAPAQPKVIANGHEPDAGAGGSGYGDMQGFQMRGFLGSTYGGTAYGFESLVGVYGGLLGDGDFYGGGFGFGTSGIGYGGGGTGWGTIGVGSGGMEGTESSLGLGHGRTTSGLDAAVISRYIKGQLKQIRSCYERRLLVEPTLGGRVSTEFTIGADGKVTVQSVAGFDADVDACIEAILATIQFPAPAGGIAVTVKYPFVFHSVD